MEKYDLAIIGAGTYGEAIAYTAILSGLKVALIEAGKVGQGINGLAANANATGMFQPGAKYIQSDHSIVLSDALGCRLVKMVLGDLLEEKCFLMPLVNDYKFHHKEPVLLDAYFGLYDRYSKICMHPPHRMLSREELVKKEPRLRSCPNLHGGLEFYEWVGDTILIARTFAKAFQNCGGVLLENTRVTKLNLSADHRVESMVAVGENGRENEIFARYFVNATSAWIPSLLRPLGINIELRPTRGTSIVIGVNLIDNPVVVFDKKGQYITMMPKDGLTVIGPTNYDIPREVKENPDLLRPAVHEKEELLAVANHFLGLNLGVEDIVGIRCALRSQPDDQGVPYKITHQIIMIDHAKHGINNLLSITGGKLTVQLYPVAKEVVEYVCQAIGKDFDWKVILSRIDMEGKVTLHASDFPKHQYKKRRITVISKPEDDITKKTYDNSLLQKSLASSRLAVAILKRLIFKNRRGFVK